MEDRIIMSVYGCCIVAKNGSESCIQDFDIHLRIHTAINPEEVNAYLNAEAGSKYHVIDGWEIITKEAIEIPGDIICGAHARGLKVYVVALFAKQKKKETPISKLLQRLGCKRIEQGVLALRYFEAKYRKDAIEIAEKGLFEEFPEDLWSYQTHTTPQEINPYLIVKRPRIKYLYQ